MCIQEIIIFEGCQHTGIGYHDSQQCMCGTFVNAKHSRVDENCNKCEIERVEESEYDKMDDIVYAKNKKHVEFKTPPTCDCKHEISAPAKYDVAVMTKEFEDKFGDIKMGPVAIDIPQEDKPARLTGWVNVIIKCLS